METFSSRAVLILKPTTATPPNLDSADENVTSEVSPSTHHWELIEDPKKPPDVSFQAVDKIALYSKNVIQEKNTTPEVNRESIANLESTRKQWETILTPVTEKEQSPVKTTKSGSVRHWEVKLPSKSPPPKPAPVVTEQSNGISDMADTENESAIEREIRLALEREEMIKKEQMEREQILKPKGKVDIGIFQSNEDDENFKPNYHEMTEADRGSELRKRESMIQEELREQEERERAVSREVVEEVAEENSIEEPENPRESIIEKEIRLQREREEEIARIRQLKISANNSKDAPKEKEEVFDEADGEVQNDINHNESKDISYESAIQGYQHEGESRIAKELRELREREEELQRQRQMLSKGNAVTPASASQSSVAPKKEADVPKPETEKKHIPVPSVKTGTWQRDVSPFVQHKNRRESEHSLDSSHSTLKSESDSGMKSESPPNSFNIEISEETPIEREIRLARERENEFRRSKGLPELPLPKSPPKEPESPSTGTVQTFPRHNVAAPSAMRRFASSRLQHEIIAQKQRELDLRKEGKIITTSEEHIEPLKYVSVIGENKTSGSVKRNFVTRRSATASSSDRTEDETASDTSSNASQTAGTHTPDPVAPARRSVIAGSGSTTFSYRESHQTAESKIERELREMREREDELRKLHCRPNPAENESPKETSENGEAESERLTPKRVNLAAQWEQMCNK